MGAFPALDLSDENARGTWFALLSMVAGATVLTFHFASFALNDPNVSAWALERTEDTQRTTLEFETAIHTHGQDTHYLPVQHTIKAAKVSPGLHPKLEAKTRPTSKQTMREVAGRAVLGVQLGENASSGWTIVHYGTVWLCFSDRSAVIFDNSV